MMKGIVTAAVCIVILAAIDHEFYRGQHTDEVLLVLRQIRYSFGL
jgi:hypothetical protein